MTAISDKDRAQLENGTERMNRIRYMNFIIYEFARGFKRPLQETFIYLEEYGGLDFLMDNYEYEHTCSAHDTSMNLLKVCRKNGGWL